MLKDQPSPRTQTHSRVTIPLTQSFTFSSVSDRAQSKPIPKRCTQHLQPWLRIQFPRPLLRHPITLSSFPSPPIHPPKFPLVLHHSHFIVPFMASLLEQISAHFFLSPPPLLPSPSRWSPPPIWPSPF